MSSAYGLELGLPELRAVVAVAELRSFGAAARLLGTTQPTVSRAVARVERDLGVLLFDRSTRRVDLTAAGRNFIDAAQLALGDIDRAVAAARSVSLSSSPALSVAMLPSVAQAVLAPTISRVQDHRLKRITCTELLQRPLEDHVMAGRSEVGIADTSGLPPELRATALWAEDAYICAPLDHPLATRDQVELPDLAGHTMVGFPTRARLRVQLDEALAAAKQRRTPWIIVEQYQTLFSLVAAGLGIAVVPGVVTSHLPTTVAAVVLAEPALRRTVGVVARAGAQPSPTVQAFVEALRAAARQHRALHQADD